MRKCTVVSVRNTRMRALLVVILTSVWEIFRATFKFFIPNAKKSVTGEVVLITGAAQGIGRELALVYASKDAKVVCVDIKGDANRETVKMVNDLRKGKGHAYTCDVSHYESVIELCKQIENEIGPVTILVNNAGVIGVDRFWEWSKSQIEGVVNVNVMGPFWTVKAILPSMMKNNYGHIVTLSSMVCFATPLNLVPYSATKCAVKGFMDGLRNELATINNCKIQITTVYPYTTETEMADLCKIKYPTLMPSIKPNRAAKIIVSAQRRDVENVTIPTHYFVIVILCQLLPTKVLQLLFNYFEVLFDKNH